MRNLNRQWTSGRDNRAKPAPFEKTKNRLAEANNAGHCVNARAETRRHVAGALRVGRLDNFSRRFPAIAGRQ
jgi:hypothetical protein